MRTTAQILRDYRGPALFSFGFRPFFLLAAIWAVLALPLWMLVMFGWGNGASMAVTRDWHVHEMLFGYTGAVIVGYMIVAGANWTGNYPIAGRPVIVFALLWIAGRVAMLLEPVLGPLAAGVIDSAFLVLFALALWREQLAASNWRSVSPCIIISLFALANAGFDFASSAPEIRALSERAALGLVSFLIALMGGRLVPSFTRNWMAQRRLGPEPPPVDRLDMAVMAVVGAGIAAWIVWPSASVSGWLLVAAGIGLGIRLGRWQGWRTASEGMVIILHLAYFWCASGLAMLGGSVLAPDHIPPTAAVHALTVGAIGGMTLAMMTRTSRSHTGRQRHADGATLAIYALINAAALGRVLAPFLPDSQMHLLGLSTICWTLAFGLFALIYGKMLVRPWVRKGSSG